MTSPANLLKTQDPTHREIREKLDRLNALLATKDSAILAEFTASPDMILIGSEAGEVVEGGQAFEDFIDRLFALPLTIRWDWRTVRIAQERDIAWVFANGDVVVSDVSGEKRSAYRMTGVLQRHDGRWVWRLFHGSEPKP